MHVSRFCAVLLMISCCVALLTPCVVAHEGVLAANNCEDVLLKVDVNLDRQSTGEGTGTIYDIALSPDGRTFVYSTWNDEVPNTLDGIGYLVLRETKSRKILWKIKAHISGVWCLAFSPDGKLLATGSSDEHVKLWDAATGKLLFDLTGHTCC